MLKITLKFALQITKIIFLLSKRHKFFLLFNLIFTPIFNRIFDYEYVYERTKLYEDFIKKDFIYFIELPKNKKVLDVGCGAGVLTTLTSGVGIDRIKYPQWASNFFIIGDAEYLPFKKSSFDLVILSNLLEHVDDYKKVISEAKRVSKDMIYVSFPTKYSFSALYHYLSKTKKYSAFYGGLDYDMVKSSFSSFRVLKENERFLPFKLKNNFSNPEILFKKKNI